MWIMLNNAFLSIVANHCKPNELLVRARAKGHIEAAFAEDGPIPVLETPDADYRFRASIPRSVVTARIARQVYDIDYPNFKNSVDDTRLHDAYLQVWGVMHRYQAAAASHAEVLDIGRTIEDCKYKGSPPIFEGEPEIP